MYPNPERALCTTRFDSFRRNAYQVEAIVSIQHGHVIVRLLSFVKGCNLGSWGLYGYIILDVSANGFVYGSVARGASRSSNKR